MKARQNNDLEALPLKEDVNRVLNPDWRDAFLSFMEISHLPPERLMRIAKALFTAYPADPSKVDRRYPPTVEDLSRWTKKIYAAPTLAYRRACQEKFDKAEGLVCCLGSAPRASALENIADKNQ